ncbi:MAG: NUDIX domain-containing protein [Actinomycetota bacterium]
MGFEGTTLWRVRQTVGTDLLLWPGASVMVVREDGRVLMGRRLDNGLWAIPGGGAEEGSSFSDTAVTELREEVGLEADPADLEGYACISRPDNHLETYPNGDVTHYFGIWFVLRRWRGDPVGDGEGWASSPGSTSTTRPSRCCDRPESVSSCIARGWARAVSRPTDRRHQRPRRRPSWLRRSRQPPGWVTAAS